MAGHSKWANTKHRKERADKKKGKIFTRIMKELISAVKQNGPDPKSNSKLRSAIQKAREANIPNETIERNIKKASSSDQQDYLQLTYELYGFGGVGLLVDIMTDNKNRIASEIRIATNKLGGTIAAPGSVSYHFDRKAIFRISKEKVKEEELFLLVTDAGAEEFKTEEDGYIVIAPVEAFASIKEALEQKKIISEEQGLEFIPKTSVEVTDEQADQNIALIEYLENLEDVDAVYHNMHI